MNTSRDSRVRNRNRLGIGTDISAQVVPESESEPGFQQVDKKLWNRCEHKEILLVKDSESEPKHRDSRVRTRNRLGIGIEF